MAYKIVIADDEKALADTLTYAFKREGYEVYTAYDGKTALQMLESVSPDIGILDVSMPFLTGFDVLKALGSAHTIGIMLLTAKNELVDKVLGLELGADDYITKPFEMREVLARASALIRRIEKTSAAAAGNEKTLTTPTNALTTDGGAASASSQANGSQPFKSEELVMDYAARTASRQNALFDLTPKEFEVLWLLYSNPQRVFTRENILDQVWSMDYEGGERTVDIHIQRIRKKLGDYGESHLATVYKVGYKWVPSPDGGSR